MVFKPPKVERGLDNHFLYIPLTIYGYVKSLHLFVSIKLLIVFIISLQFHHCDIIYRHEYTAKSQIYTKILNKKNRIQNTKLQNSIGFDKCSALDLIFIDSTIQIYHIKKFSLLKMS